MFYHDQQVIDVITTYKFRKDHLMVVSSREELQEAKKRAEERFLSRGVDVNTLIVATPEKLRLLYGEVMRQQEQFKRNPDAPPLVSLVAFEYFERKCKRAVLHPQARLVYNVRRDGSMYKIHHLAGMQ